MTSAATGLARGLLPEVVEVDYAFDQAFFDYYQGSDFFLFHLGERVGGEGCGGDRLGCAVHDVAGGAIEGAGSYALQQASEVAVGDDAGEEEAGLFCRFRGGFEDGGHAEALAGHLVDDLRHEGSGGDAGHGLARVHDVAYAGEASAEASAGVKVGEVVGFEAGAAAELEGDRVAQGQHDGGGGCRGEVERAGLFADANVQGDYGGVGQRGAEGRGEGDDAHLQPREHREQANQFLCFPGVGERDDDVAGGKDAEVTVEGLDGMEKDGGCTGGDEGCGDFTRDDSGFSDARDSYAVALFGGVGNEGESVLEGGPHLLFQPVGEAVQGVGFNPDEVGERRFWAECGFCGHIRLDPIMLAERRFGDRLERDE